MSEKILKIDKKRNFLKSLPEKPGVYLFLDKEKNILYVGRSTILRKRVSSYFQKAIDERLQEMIQNASFIKIIPTANILESVILEANLIKKYWPKYNIRERDDRSFVYLVISLKQDFPRPLILRKKELEKIPLKGVEVFGPYKSYSLVKTFLRIIRRVFPYSACKINSGKPCFDYQIGLCPGACLGIISKEDYRKNIENMILLLKGEKKRLIQKLKKENPNKILALKHLEDVALIKEEELKEERFLRIEGYDISHFFGKETVGAMVSFLNGEPDKSFYRLFKIKSSKEKDDLMALEEVLKRRFNHKEWPFPDLVLVDGGLPQVQRAKNVLRELGLEIPIVGISKYQNDKLVFPKGLKKNLKNLIELSKNLLLKVRDEAHRFANKYRKKLLKKKIT